MIWVTGDTHFYHANIIRYTCRPFSDVSQMVEALGANWNGAVTQDDTVYVLGDFAMDRGYEHEVQHTFETLHGHKRLLGGNHDRRFVLDLPWEAVENEEAVDGMILLHDGEKHAGPDAPRVLFPCP
jgi:calcineurin-like phosphoesterase family protein